MGVPARAAHFRRDLSAATPPTVFVNPTMPVLHSHPLFAAWRDWPAAPAASDLLLVLASLTAAAALWLQRGRRGAPLRPVFLVLAGFAVACAAGDALAMLPGTRGGFGSHGPRPTLPVDAGFAVADARVPDTGPRPGDR